MRKSLDALYAQLDERARMGEIRREDVPAVLKARANEMVSHLDLTAIPTEDAWQYGEVFKTAERWDLARAAFLVASKNAKTEDRRVNDTLRLAFCEARLGSIDEAIRLVRSVFDTPESDKAPILPATLLEVVPAARGKGRDPELAKLLEEAIGQHLQVRVDPSTVAGKAYLLAKRHHIRHAWGEVVRLYIGAGEQAAADALKRCCAASLRSDLVRAHPAPTLSTDV